MCAYAVLNGHWGEKPRWGMHWPLAFPPFTWPYKLHGLPYNYEHSVHGMHNYWPSAGSSFCKTPVISFAFAQESCVGCLVLSSLIFLLIEKTKKLGLLRYSPVLNCRSPRNTLNSFKVQVILNLNFRSYNDLGKRHSSKKLNFLNLKMWILIP